MGRNLVSVVVPTYNTQRSMLRRCLESVVTQSHRALDIIVVDDGSGVPFSGLEESFPDPRITWLRLEENGGIARARNAGIRSARGDYIAFLDSDDWWDREKIRLQLELFGTSPVTRLGAVYCGASRVQAETGVTEVKHPVYRGDLFHRLLVRQVVTGSASAVMIRRDVVRSVGAFFDRYDLPEDREYWLRMARHGWRFDFVTKPLVYLNVAGESRSADPVKKRETLKRILHLYKEELVTHKRHDAAWAHYYFEIAGKMRRRNLRWGAVRFAGKGALRHFAGVISLAVEFIRIHWMRMGMADR